MSRAGAYEVRVPGDRNDVVIKRYLAAERELLSSPRGVTKQQMSRVLDMPTWRVRIAMERMAEVLPHRYDGKRYYLRDRHKYADSLWRQYGQVCGISPWKTPYEVIERIEAILVTRAGVSLREIAIELQISRSTVRRYVDMISCQQFVTETEDGRYSLDKERYKRHIMERYRWLLC